MILQVLSWLWPLAATPDRHTGWDFPTNDFEGTFVSPNLRHMPIY